MMDLTIDMFSYKTGRVNRQGMINIYNRIMANILVDQQLSELEEKRESTQGGRQNTLSVNMELLDIMKNLTIKHIPSESDQQLFKSIAADIDDVPTEIVFAEYSDKIMLIVSQYQKIGSMLMIQKDQVHSPLGTNDIYTTKVIFGAAGEEPQVAARYLAEAIKITKPLCIFINLKSYDIETVKACKEKLKMATVSAKKFKSVQKYYGQLVLGPPGAGKTTYCGKMSELLRKLGRNVVVINLDPANDVTSYKPDIDIRELISLEEVMDQHHLGPNGALLYCMEFLEKNIQWLLSQINGKMSRNLKENYNKLIEIEMEIDQLLNAKKYIQVKLLHQYNDIKDAAQIVISHIANLEETTITEVHKRLKLKE
ncbi:hypothetical protein HW555_008708 [Spodoptera exigua]|uniref:GPN-loop GTPase 2 n=1 Tax=Spodoptera exigua TaxID=7107 RepID=A0A835GDU1_SPOEX|nr:hypothetical protein HW555_008708 [Spodoptera exigua]